MTYTKIFLKKVGVDLFEFEIPSDIPPAKGYETYFTGDKGFEYINSLPKEKLLTFHELPKPLLKLIK